METMLTYIEASPERIERIVANRKQYTARLVDLFSEKNYRNIWIVACGSSYNGCICAKNFLMKYLKVDVKMVNPNNFIYGEHNFNSDDFVLFASQSGCSTNTIAAIEFFKEKGGNPIALTGNIDGDFKDHCDNVIDWCCGEEKVGYVTAGVSTLALFLMCFGLEASLKLNKINEEKYQQVVMEMEDSGRRNKIVKENTEVFIEDNFDELLKMSIVYNAGFSSGFACCNEGALKIGETIKVPSFCYEAEEFAHGPNLQLNSNYSVFFIDDFGKGSSRLNEIYYATKATTDKVYYLGNNENTDEKRSVRLPFEIKEETLAPVYCLPFYQLIAYRITEAKNGWEKPAQIREFNKRLKTKTEKVYELMPEMRG